MSSAARSALPAFASQHVERGLLWHCQWPGRPVKISKETIEHALLGIEATCLNIDWKSQMS